MCGIAGWVGEGPTKQRPIPPNLLQHRGPDGIQQRVYSGPTWSATLHHTRLAINDLSDAGMQPMPSRCSGLVLCFNGEIYNSPELRRLCQSRGHTFHSSMDGEVILHLWEDEGAEALRHLNGIYGLCVLDTATGALTLARDPLGVKPLFFATDDRGVTFGSEIRAVTDLLDVPCHEDVRGLAAFLTFLWVPAPWTPLREVHQLRPGEVLTWSPREPTRVHPGVHRLELPDELRRPSREQAAAELHRHLTAATQRQLLSDVPIGIMASGGVDSTLLWHYAGSRLTRAYTIDSPEGTEGLDEDTRAASLYAARTGTPLDLVPPPEPTSVVARSGDLLADPSFLLVGSIAARARATEIKVLLSGQGGDELLGGYRRHTAALILQRSRGLRRLLQWGPNLRDRGGSMRYEYAQRLHKAARQGTDFNAYASLLTYSDARERAAALDVDEQEADDDVVLQEHRRAWEQMPTSWSFAKRAVTLDLLVYLPGLGLSYVDRAAMEHGVEVRVPWLDLDMVRWALQLDPCVFLGLRRKIPALDLSKSCLPHFVWCRPKRGFGVGRESLPSNGHGASRRTQYINLAMASLQLRLDQTDKSRAKQADAS
ncbi:MAG: asparagine synthase (glutamine-hydrolyzing) [Actinomycetota bacterium]|nr:asparagine synthase (glutamine-hydrolyzing) [Actinomycetota bacterium]